MTSMYVVSIKSDLNKITRRISNIQNSYNAMQNKETTYANEHRELLRVLGRVRAIYVEESQEARK